MKLKITVHGVAYEEDVQVLDAGEGFPAIAAHHPRPHSAANGQSANPTPSKTVSTAPVPTAGENGGSVTSPIAGTVLELKCRPGDEVTKGQVLIVIEAMKMKTSIAAPTSGKIKSIPVAVGDSVQESQSLVEFE